MAKKNLVQIHRVFLSFGHKIKSLKRIRYTFIKKVKKYEEQLSVINIYSFNPPTSSSQSSNPPPSSVLEVISIIKNAAKRSRQHARIQRRLSSNERTNTRGDAPTIYPNERTHIFSSRGGAHPQCNPTNGHTYFYRGEGGAPTM